LVGRCCVYCGRLVDCVGWLVVLVVVVIVVVVLCVISRFVGLVCCCVLGCVGWLVAVAVVDVGSCYVVDVGLLLVCCWTFVGCVG